MYTVVKGATPSSPERLDLGGQRSGVSGAGRLRCERESGATEVLWLKGTAEKCGQEGRLTLTTGAFVLLTTAGASEENRCLVGGFGDC